MTPALMRALVVGAGLPANEALPHGFRGQARSHSAKTSSTLRAR